MVKKNKHFPDKFSEHTLAPCQRLFLLPGLQLAKAQTGNMGLIPTPSSSLTEGRGHASAWSGGQMSQSWSWNCHQVLFAQSALVASSLKGKTVLSSWQFICLLFKK